MPSVAETEEAGTELAAGLRAGLDTLSLNQVIEFRRYVRLVLPLDGYVYWVLAGLTEIAPPTADGNKPVQWGFRADLTNYSSLWDGGVAGFPLWEGDGQTITSVTGQSFTSTATAFEVRWAQQSYGWAIDNLSPDPSSQYAAVFYNPDVARQSPPESFTVRCRATFGVPSGSYNIVDGTTDGADDYAGFMLSIGGPAGENLTHLYVVCGADYRDAATWHDTGIVLADAQDHILRADYFNYQARWEIYVDDVRVKSLVTAPITSFYGLTGIMASGPGNGGSAPMIFSDAEIVIPALAGDTAAEWAAQPYGPFTQSALLSDYAKTSSACIKAKGSLHYATDTKQNEDESIAVNRVVFTSEVEIEPLNAIDPDTLYIGTFGDIRFAFNSRSSRYKQAGLNHYTGDAIYPAMETQIIDQIEDLNIGLVVSNSLPIWLRLNQYMPMYPSFAVPENVRPPYASVHIEPSATRALQAFPLIGKYGDHMQLVADKVKITIYGLDNDAALDFQDYVFQYSLNTDDIGFMNMPVIRDEKRTQSEMTVLAMKKSLECEVSYYQARARAVARRLIQECIPSYIIQ